MEKECLTTSFVFREFLRTIIWDLGYVRSQVSNPEIGSKPAKTLRRLMRLLARGEGRYHPRAAGRQYYIVMAILGEFPRRTVSREELLTFLEMTSEQWIEDFFETPEDRIQGDRYLRALDDSPDEMEQWVQNHRPIPDPPPFPSRAASFLDQRKPEVHEAEAAMRTARRKDKRLLAILDRLKSGSEYDFLGKLKVTTRGNWALGDLLITLETPPDASIYTIDRHFHVLCRALRRRLYKGYHP